MRKIKAAVYVSLDGVMEAPAWTGPRGSARTRWPPSPNSKEKDGGDLLVYASGVLIDALAAAGDSAE